MGNVCGSGEDVEQVKADVKVDVKPVVFKKQAAGMPTGSGSIKVLTSMAEFNAFKAQGVCIVDAFATWCPPCVEIAPKYEAISNNFIGKVNFAKFQVDQCPEITQSMRIRCMPTFVVYSDGNEVDRLEGASEQGIIHICNKHSPQSNANAPGQNSPAGFLLPESATLTTSLTMLTNMDGLNNFKAEGVCIVDAYATWCGACVVIAPEYEAISKNFIGRVKFGKFDIDRCQDIAQYMQIRCMPTFVIYKGGVEVDRMEGASEQGIIDICNKHA